MNEEKKYAKDVTVGDLARIVGAWEVVEQVRHDGPNVWLYTDSGDWCYQAYSSLVTLA